MRNRNNLNNPIVMISMDAAEPSLIEKWTGDGSLPILSKLKKRGSYSRLNSTADFFAGSVWPAFYTGTHPAKNNMFNYIQWNHHAMKFMKPSPSWLPARPFWRDLSDKGIKILIIDTPFAYPAEPVNGVEITGITTIEHISYPSFYPRYLENHIKAKFGNIKSIFEPYGLVKYRTLMKLRDELINIVEYIEKVSLELINRHEADLIMINFQSTHTAGHKFWDASNLKEKLSEDESDEFSKSLKLVYEACDLSIGMLLKEIGEYAHLFIYSLHGMGFNTSRSDILPDMLDKVLGYNNNKHFGNILERLRRATPLEIRNTVKSKLPRNLQDYLTQYWRNNSVRMKHSKTVPMIMDLQGMVRLNLKGREQNGRVNIHEYDDLCNLILDGITDYKDPNTNQNIITDIFMAKEFYGGIPYNSFIPDLILNWIKTPNNTSDEYFSANYGKVKWPTPGYSPDGRSGNHMPEGFIIYNGGMNDSNINKTNNHILDLAPTIYKLFKIDKPDLMLGNSII